jgi:tagatose-1,6-bisphosphate aldolase non-catalytic subunit AgaZ/GatZ
MLDVFRPEVFRRRLEILLVQPGLVEFEHRLLIGFQSAKAAAMRPSEPQ